MRWFFTKLREVIREVEDLAFVIDRGQSIINGIAEVFPDAYHGYCMYHIQGNLKTRYIVEIGSKSFPAWDYLMKMGIEHWARSYFSGRRYNMMMLNNAEFVNALFKKDRELPILALIENIPPAQEVKLFKTVEAARKLNVEPLDESRFSVECAHHTAYMVDLSDGTCTCKQFQLESFPCEHAVAVAMYQGFAARTLCSAYYTAENWRPAYVETIFPLPNEVEWEVPDHIRSFNTLSPPLIEPRDPGRQILLEYHLLKSFLDGVDVTGVNQ
ncbi:uncharacterized protein LOC111404507 [Olea europaea var. sylvestris]|uniref:uncharacterized protein LOC111404507 n=1 Tax=Olea europaea var. sylvestris TaxID=158386 RepID=UPI000C1CEFC6|nr:uncharacterized protein LOC111404507 [Olea europaea var. sylvestris]